MTLRDLARSHGKTLQQLGLAGAYASQLNTGLERAGADAISRISAALGVEVTTVSAILDATYKARHGEPLPAASSSPPMSLEAASAPPAADPSQVSPS